MCVLILKNLSSLVRLLNLGINSDAVLYNFWRNSAYKWHLIRKWNSSCIEFVLHIKMWKPLKTSTTFWFLCVLIFHSKRSKKVDWIIFPSKHSETNLKHTFLTFVFANLFSCNRSGFILLRFLYYSIRIPHFRIYQCYALKLHAI